MELAPTKKVPLNIWFLLSRACERNFLIPGVTAGLTNNQLGLVAFNWESFCRKYSEILTNNQLGLVSFNWGHFTRNNQDIYP